MPRITSLLEDPGVLATELAERLEWNFPPIFISSRAGLSQPAPIDGAWFVEFVVSDQNGEAGRQAAGAVWEHWKLVIGHGDDGRPLEGALIPANRVLITHRGPQSQCPPTVLAVGSRGDSSLHHKVLRPSREMRPVTVDVAALVERHEREAIEWRLRYPQDKRTDSWAGAIAERIAARRRRVPLDLLPWLAGQQDWPDTPQREGTTATARLEQGSVRVEIRSSGLLECSDAAQQMANDVADAVRERFARPTVVAVCDEDTRQHARSTF